MGLTIHYKIRLPEPVGTKEAERLVMEGRKLALRMKRRGLFDGVGPVAWDRSAREAGRLWLTCPVPGEVNTSWGIEVLPVAGFMFRVDVGRDCEPLWLGLCEYPEKVNQSGRTFRVRGGRGWRLDGFSKTQFASLHGWEHFQRCHCAVVDLLVEWRRLDMRVTLSDEGEFWPRRSLAALRRNLDLMNGVVAATAGALKDADESLNGRSRIESPIFAHHHFERLEAAGESRVAPALKQLQELVRP